MPGVESFVSLVKLSRSRATMIVSAAKYSRMLQRGVQPCQKGSPRQSDSSLTHYVNASLGVMAAVERLEPSVCSDRAISR
jgi:hypothetical protein